MEVGVGIHGELGSGRSASEIADKLCEAVIAELEFTVASSVAVLVNSLGATPVEECYIVFDRIAQRLTSARYGWKGHWSVGTRRSSRWLGAH